MYEHLNYIMNTRGSKKSYIPHTTRNKISSLTSFSSFSNNFHSSCGYDDLNHNMRKYEDDIQTSLALMDFQLNFDLLKFKLDRMQRMAGKIVGRKYSGVKNGVKMGVKMGGYSQVENMQRKSVTKNKEFIPYFDQNFTFKSASNHHKKKSSISDVDLDDIVTDIIELRGENKNKINTENKTKDKSINNYNFNNNAVNPKSKRSFSFKYLLANMNNEDQVDNRMDSPVKNREHKENSLDSSEGKDITPTKERKISVYEEYLKNTIKNTNVDMNIKKNSRHSKNLSLSSIDLKKIIDLSELLKRKAEDSDSINTPLKKTSDTISTKGVFRVPSPHPKTISSRNHPQVIQSNYSMNSPLYDIASMLQGGYNFSKTERDSKNKSQDLPDVVNISQFDFENLFNEEEDKEIIKKIGLQKLNYLIKESQKEQEGDEKLYEDDEDNNYQGESSPIIPKNHDKNDQVIIPAYSQNLLKHYQKSTCKSRSRSKTKKQPVISLCKKFKENPSKFFTEPPTDSLLKSLNLSKSTANNTNNTVTFPNDKLNAIDDMVNLNLSEIKEEQTAKLHSSYESSGKEMAKILVEGVRKHYKCPVKKKINF